MARNRLKPIWTLILATMLPAVATAEQRMVGNFSQGDMTGWQEKSFKGHSHYQLTDSSLQADTRNAASGLFKEIDIDLNKTPYLNWRWRVNNIYQGNDERSKAGDDYPARVYVVVSGGLFFWRTRAVNYVWSSNQAVSSQWDNAYTGNAKMIAVRSGADQTGQWLTEKRNVRQDLKQLFGEEFDQINAVAIMSDSDNSGQSARAYYGDIFFSSD